MEVVNILIVVIIFAVLFDLILISTQYLHLSKIGNQVARTVAVQSGLKSSTPSNYPGGNQGYYTTSEIYNFLDENMKESNFEAYYLEINNTLMSRLSSKVLDYKDVITVELSAEFKWMLLGNFIPGLSADEHYITVKKVVYAEYQQQGENNYENKDK